MILKILNKKRYKSYKINILLQMMNKIQQKQKYKLLSKKNKSYRFNSNKIMKNNNKIQNK